MPSLCEKSRRLTAYLEWQLKRHCVGVDIQTPPERGAMLSLRLKKSPQTLEKSLQDRGVFVDFRPPDLLRVTPAPLYNSFEDIFRFVRILKEVT